MKHKGEHDVFVVAGRQSADWRSYLSFSRLVEKPSYFQFGCVLSQRQLLHAARSIINEVKSEVRTTLRVTNNICYVNQLNSGIAARGFLASLVTASTRAGAPVAQC